MKKAQIPGKRASPGDIPLDDTVTEKKPKVTSIKEMLNDKVTPLWRLSYEDQLAQKQQAMQKAIKKYCKEISQRFDKSVLLDIKPCPPEAINGYRNKCEFSFAHSGVSATEGADNEIENKENSGLLTDDIEVGFLMGMYKEGITSVASADECLHVPEFVKKVAKITKEFVNKEKSNVFTAYDRVKKEGFWRLLMVRYSERLKNFMILVQVNKINDVDLYAELKQKLCEFYEKEFCNEYPEWSLLFQVHDGVHNGITENELELYRGSGFIFEELIFNDSVFSENSLVTKRFKFKISPFSFFQSNTPACEVLYGLIGEWVNEGPKDKIVLDLCSGTGTIGICLSRFGGIKKIVGIEIIPDAVKDAIENAKLNGLEVGPEGKIDYICDKVESALSKLLKSFKDVEIVAVLDPPRAGVHKSVIAAIRGCPLIKQLTYVSCNPKAALENWVQLSRPTSKRYVLEPFKLEKAQPVDMFPHTEHCELVLKFVRQ